MKVMFICTGNICRSAMAHHLFERKIQEKRLADIEVFSCGIFAQEGERATGYAKKVMENYRISMENHRATPVEKSKIEQMDLILCATRAHKTSLIQKYPELRSKIFTMKEYAEYPGTDWDIEDPWGQSIEMYQESAKQIEKVLDKLLEK